MKQGLIRWPTYTYAIVHIEVSTLKLVWFSGLWMTTMRLQATSLSVYTSMSTTAGYRYWPNYWESDCNLDCIVITLIWKCMLWFSDVFVNILIESTCWCWRHYSTTYDNPNKSGLMFNCRFQSCIFCYCLTSLIHCFLQFSGQYSFDGQSSAEVKVLEILSQPSYLWVHTLKIVMFSYENIAVKWPKWQNRLNI